MSKKGFSLIELLVASAVGVLLISVAVLIAQKMLKGKTQISQQVDLSLIRWTLRDEIDCYQTLKIKDKSSVYHTCTNQKYVLRNRLGTNLEGALQNSQWEFQILCQQKPKTDPKPYGELLIQYRRKIVSPKETAQNVWKDLFDGLGYICSQNLSYDKSRDYNESNETPCPSKDYPIFGGTFNGRAACCQEIKNFSRRTSGTDMGDVHAVCQPKEGLYREDQGTMTLMVAGGECKTNGKAGVSKTRTLPKTSWQGMNQGVGRGRLTSPGPPVYIPMPWGQMPNFVPHTHTGKASPIIVNLNINGTYEDRTQQGIGAFLNRVGLSTGIDADERLTAQGLARSGKVWRNLSHGSISVCYDNDWGGYQSDPTSNKIYQDMQVDSAPYALCCPNVEYIDGMQNLQPPQK
jgi:prepilin-type N-terminal cleavage/methylation domain-containing protein